MPNANPPLSAALTAWQQRGRYLETAQGRLFYIVAGVGEPLLLLHGFPTSSWDWHQVIDRLAQRYRVITLDKLGYGFSDKPVDGDYSIPAHLQRVQQLLVHLGVSETLLLTHDNGNSVTQEWLAQQIEGEIPVRLRRICFLNGGLFPETHRQRPLQRLLLSPLGGLLARFGTESRFGRGLADVFGPDTQPSATELADYWALISRDQGNRLLHKHINYIRERRAQRTRWVGGLINSPVEISLIDGVQDPVSGAHMVVRFRQLLPGRPVIELACGHFPQVELPDQVLAAFDELWRDQSLRPL